jgi:hypothetical protein
MASRHIPPPSEQARIAEAAHRAVCEVTDSDGYGLAIPYAIAGQAILLSAGFQIQAGTLMILADPTHAGGSGCVGMDASNGGFERGNFHSWLARQVGPHVEVLDLSSRHYRRQVEKAESDLTSPTGGDGLWRKTAERIHWTRLDEPPSWVWTQRGHAEGLAYFMPDEATCLKVVSLVARDPMTTRIRDSARRHYAALASGSAPR